MLGSVPFIHLFTVLAVNPETVEEVPQNCSQRGADNRTGDKRCFRRTQPQHVVSEEHASGLNQNAKNIHKGKFDALTFPVLGSVFAEGPQAVHNPCKDGSHNAGNYFCLGMCVLERTKHQRPHHGSVYQECGTANGTEFKYL